MYEARLASGDHPILTQEEDLLGRAAVAERLAAELRSLDASRGSVVGLFGSWGSGKTSLLNLTEESLAAPPELLTIRFDPWMFSGTEQLIAIFFAELAAQLRLREKKLDKIADLVAEYGGLLSSSRLPIVGDAGSVSGWLATFGRRRRARRQTVGAQKTRLVEALTKLAAPLVVMIDDIDRLEPAEVRDILRLVRLVGEFPNVIYLLAFEREHVEDLLSARGFDGRRYLDKIVSVPFDVPPLPEPTLLQLLLLELGRVTENTTTGPFDEHRWQDVFYRCVRPLFSNVREVKRYLAVVRTSLVALTDEVALEDVLALEAIRVRLPDVHALLCANPDALSEQRQGSRGALPADLQQILEAAGEYASVVQDLCRLLFPVTERFFDGGSHWGPEWVLTWRRERRVASRHVFSFYVHGVLPDRAAPARDVEAAFEALTDESALRNLFESLNGDVIEDLLGRLEAYQEDFPESAAVPACPVLLALYGRLRTRSLGMLDVGPELAIDRVVIRLLKCVPQSVVAHRVSQINYDTDSLYGRLRLLWLIGNRPHVGQKLIDTDDEGRLASQLRIDIRASDACRLASERDVLALLDFALESDPSSRAAIDELQHDDALFNHLLTDSLTEMRSQAIGSAALHREPALRWETLVSVVGGHAALRRRLEQRDAGVAEDDASSASVAARLAQRYLEGWRPRTHRLGPGALLKRVATQAPRTYFTPVGNGMWPDLVIRAVCLFAVAPDATDLEIPGRDFHIALEAALNASGLTRVLRGVAGSRTEVAAEQSWRPDPGPYTQSSRSAVSTLKVNLGDSGVTVGARCGVLLPDGMTPSLRVIVDALVTLGGRSESEDEIPPVRSLLSLREVRDVLAAELEVVTTDVREAALSTLLARRTATPTTVEVHITAGDVMPAMAGRQGTIAEVVDLSPLGETGSLPQREIQFGIAGDTPLSDRDDRNAVLLEMFRQTANDWGYLDGPDALLQLLAD